MPISEALLRDLRAIAGSAFIDDGALRAERARDLWPQALWWDQDEMSRRAPAAVVRPGGEAEMSALLSWAGRQGVAVVPRGNGSGVCGAAAPDSPDSIVLETLALDDFSLRASGPEPSVVAGAGFLGGELERRLNERGFSLLHFPASLEISTVGGWIAAGSSGQMSTLYGDIRPQVMGVRTALGSGEMITESVEPTFLSEGALGIVTQAQLRVRVLPKNREFLSARFETLEPALFCARELAVSERPPAVVRLYDALDAGATGLSKEDGAGLLPESWSLALRAWALGHPNLVTRALGGPHWWLVVVLEDAAPAESARVRAAFERLGGRRDDEPARRWWGRRYHWDHRKLKGLMARDCFVDTLDLAAPWERLAALYAALCKARPEGVLGMGHFAHFEASGACLYVSVAGRRSAREITRQAHAETWRALIEAAVVAGAKPTHHHGVGLAKRPWQKLCLGPRLENQRRLKAQRDYRGILQPGRL